MPKILAVDDDPVVRELLRDFLRSRGYQVETAADGASALEAIRRHAPDLLLLDLMMPGVTGMEVLRRLPASTQMPVIVVTAVTEEDVGRAALRGGAVDYVTKPIDLAYLERAVAAALLTTQV